ncbi:hypothetical protein ACQBAU_01010 [Propionibacteriaceae bacterium Y2011]
MTETTRTGAGLSGRRGQLVVSLPANEVELAKIALDAGADVVKVHLNLKHMSGHEFGTFADNAAEFAKIIELGAPVGLVPGAGEVFITKDELDQALAMGFDFVNADMATAPSYFADPAVPFVPSGGGAPGSLGYLAGVSALQDMPGDWMEASGVNLEGHRKPLPYQDLLSLRETGRVSGRRLIVPSVRTLVPTDVPRLFDIPDVWAVMIGAYVTGTTAESLQAAVTAFRAAFDELGFRRAA